MGRRIWMNLVWGMKHVRCSVNINNKLQRSHSTNSAFGAVSQGINGELSVGGSSGGSAIAVASQQCWA